MSPTEEIVYKLSQNTINLYLSTKTVATGLSSAIDLALASGRPFGISSSPMYSHLSEIEQLINVEKNSLQNIIKLSNSVFDIYRYRWSARNFTTYVESHLLKRINI